MPTYTTTQGTLYLTPAHAAAVPAYTPNTQTVDYTLAFSDIGMAVEINSASSKALTVPPEATVNFPIGTVIEVARIGAGAVTVTAGAGVTLRSPGAVLTLRAQYSTASVRKRASDEWIVSGDLG